MNTEEIERIAQKLGFSTEAAEHLYRSIQRGNGSMAQFNHPELGGSGQWMRGGMIMIGDMFNAGLKARVQALCEELARLPTDTASRTQDKGFAPFAAGPRWWPQEWGTPAATGDQNGIAYAYFPARQRLAIKRGDALILLDTGGYVITGFSQQQPGLDGLLLSTDKGNIPLSTLTVVETLTVPIRE